MPGIMAEGNHRIGAAEFSPLITFKKSSLAPLKRLLNAAKKSLSTLGHERNQPLQPDNTPSRGKLSKIRGES